MLKCVVAFTLIVAVFSQLTKNDDESLSNQKLDLKTLGIPFREATPYDSCVTKTGARGECVPYYLCDDGVVNTDGAGLLDNRFGDDEASCSSFLDVCCLVEENGKDDPIGPKERQGCGWRNPEVPGLGLQGKQKNKAEFGEFPWMVVIFRVSQVNVYQKSTHIGGGSLIHPSVVLTAAHVVGNHALRVRAGEWDMKTTHEPYPHQDRDVFDVDIHKNYNTAELSYDAALLYLKTPFDLAPNVGLACIPVNDKPLEMNAECFATGWGKDKWGIQGQYQTILKKINLHPVDHGTCENQLQMTSLWRYFKLHSSFMCASGESYENICTGDGGSPLVCPIEAGRDRYHQVGIASWGLQCGQSGIPGVFTNVYAIRDWIDWRLAKRSLDTAVYRY